MEASHLASQPSSQSDSQAIKQPASWPAMPRQRIHAQAGTQPASQPISKPNGQPAIQPGSQVSEPSVFLVPPGPSQKNAASPPEDPRVAQLTRKHPRGDNPDLPRETPRKPEGAP